MRTLGSAEFGQRRQQVAPRKRQAGIDTGQRQQGRCQIDLRRQTAHDQRPDLRVLLPQGRAERWRVTLSGLLPGSPLSPDEREHLHVQAVLGDWLYRNRAYAAAPDHAGPTRVAAGR